MPFICHCVLLTGHLLSFIQAMYPARFHFVLVAYWTMSVSLVLCLMMVLWILSFSLTLRIFLSIAHWLVSSFFTNAFVRDHVWHLYVIAGKTHWLKTFLLDPWEGACLKRFLCTFQKHSSFFYSYQDFLLCSVFHCYCLSKIFIVSSLLYFYPIYLYVIHCVCHRLFGVFFFLYVSSDQSLSFFSSQCLTDAPYLSQLLLLGLFVSFVSMSVLLFHSFAQICMLYFLSFLPVFLLSKFFPSVFYLFNVLIFCWRNRWFFLGFTSLFCCFFFRDFTEISGCHLLLRFFQIC